MNTYFSTFETDIGLFSVAVDESGAVVVSAFGGLEGLKRQCREIGEFIADEKRMRFRGSKLPNILRASATVLISSLQERGRNFSSVSGRRCAGFHAARRAAMARWQRNCGAQPER